LPQAVAGAAVGAGGLARGRQDLDRRDAGAEQLVGDGAAVDAFQHALHQVAARVAAFVSEERHD
jgi:hypothetical protein